MCSCPALHLYLYVEREGYWLVYIQPIHLCQVSTGPGWADSPVSRPPGPLPQSTLVPSRSADTMAEDIKTKIKNYQTAPFDSRFPNQNQTRNCWQNWTSTAMRRQCLLKRVMPPCVNDIRVCTSPSTLYPGCQPGTIARQKERFLGRSELAPPHLFCPPPFSGQ